jgi:hypothetical protein
MEEKHAMREQNFHDEITFHDLYARMPDSGTARHLSRY